MIIPQPKEIKILSRKIKLSKGTNCGIIFSERKSEMIEKAAENLSETIKAISGYVSTFDKKENDVTFVLLTKNDLGKYGDYFQEFPQSNEGYIIKTLNEGTKCKILIAGSSNIGLSYAVETLIQAMESNKVSKNGEFDAIEVCDEPCLSNRGILFDLGGCMWYTGPASWDYEKWIETIDWMHKYKFNLILLQIAGGAHPGWLRYDPYKSGQIMGYPIRLEKYPELELRDTPVIKWSKEKSKFVSSTYTAPLIRDDFLNNLIDYAHLKGIKVYLFLAYYYYAQIFEFHHQAFIHCYTNSENVEFFDYILETLLTRYKNIDGLSLHLPENLLLCECKECQKIGKVGERITKDGYIIKRAYDITQRIRPDIDFRILVDSYSTEELKKSKGLLPKDIGLDWTPPNKLGEWKETWGDVWQYMYVTKVVMQKIINFEVEYAKDMLTKISNLGYKGAYTQGWYWDNYELGFLAMAEFSWNPEADVEDFWDKSIRRLVGNKGVEESKRCFKLCSCRYWAFNLMDNLLDRLFDFSIDPDRIKEYLRTEENIIKYGEKARAVIGPNKLLDNVLSSAKRLKYFGESILEFIKGKEFREKGSLEKFMHHFLKGRRKAFIHYDILKEIEPDFPWLLKDAQLLWFYEKIYLMAHKADLGMFNQNRE